MYANLLAFMTKLRNFIHVRVVHVYQKKENKFVDLYAPTA